MNNMNIGWATQELLVLVERHVWRVVVLWWHATARWKARQVLFLCFLPRVFKTIESKVAAAGALLVWGTKACQKGCAIRTCRAKMSERYCDSASEPTYCQRAKSETQRAVMCLNRVGPCAAHHARR